MTCVLYLHMFTQEEIEEHLGLKQQTVSNRLEKITKNGKNPEICNPPDELRFRNKWEFSTRETFREVG